LRKPAAGYLLGRIDHDPQEVLYGLLGVISEARMDRRRLHHGAAGRDEVSEVLALGQHPYGAGLSSAFAHPARDLEVCLYGLGVDVGSSARRRSGSRRMRASRNFASWQ
jgi:hypothetical protein